MWRDVVLLLLATCPYLVIIIIISKPDLNQNITHMLPFPRSSLEPQQNVYRYIGIGGGWSGDALGPCTAIKRSYNQQRIRFLPTKNLETIVGILLADFIKITGAFVWWETEKNKQKGSFISKEFFQLPLSIKKETNCTYERSSEVTFVWQAKQQDILWGDPCWLNTRFHTSVPLLLNVLLVTWAIWMATTCVGYFCHFSDGLCFVWKIWNGWVNDLEMC